jgi:3-oxoacyl-[acyl-carrier-protein] synthase III
LATIELAGADADLAAAAERALAVAGASASSLDFVIVITGDGVDGVRRFTERLGIDDLPLFRLTAGSAGTHQGFYTARMLLAGGLGRGLVIGPDAARVVDAEQALCSTPQLKESTELTGGHVAYAVCAPYGLPGSGGERR